MIKLTLFHICLFVVAVFAWTINADVLPLIAKFTYILLGAEFIGGQALLLADRHTKLYSLHVRAIARDLVFLGLIGTVVGFMIALSGVDAKKATDPSFISPMVASLIEGMSIALGTTLAGAIGAYWLRWNARVIYGPR